MSDIIKVPSWLVVGNKVWWTDPDESFSSGYYTVTDILTEDNELYSDTLICLKNDAGSQAEVYFSELSEEGPPSCVTLKLTLDVTYVLNGVAQSDIETRLMELCQRAFNEGLLTGDTAAETLEFGASVREVLPPLSEDEVADFLLGQIESGAMPLEDIPVRMARYGLMEQSDFVAEMRERME